MYLGNSHSHLITISIAISISINFELIVSLPVRKINSISKIFKTILDTVLVNHVIEF